MIPAGLRHLSLHSIAYSFDPTDFINNILLYVPLGIALGATSLLRASLCGLCLSTLAESLQIGYVDRIPSPVDIASNTLGAVLGYLAARAILRLTSHDPRSLPIPRPAAAIAMLVSILGAIGLVYRMPPSDFSNWNADAHLKVGPWNGSTSQLQIYPFVLSAAQIRDLTCTGTSPLPGGGLLPTSNQRSLYDVLVRQNQLALLACLNSQGVEPYRMRLIVTYAKNWSERNFTLARMGDSLTFLLRTPASGPNGHASAVQSGPVLTAHRDVFVAAVYDGRVSRLYIDGQLAGQSDLGARRPHLPGRVLSWLPQPLPMREIEQGGAEALLSGLLCVGILGCFGVPRQRWLRSVAGIGAGALIGSIVWIVGVSAPYLGMRILLESIVAGVTIAVSAIRSGERRPGDSGSQIESLNRVITIPG
jgi:hypothetical protein